MAKQNSISRNVRRFGIISWVGIMYAYYNTQFYSKAYVDKLRKEGVIKSDAERLKNINQLPEEYKPEYIDKQKKIFKKKIQEREEQEQMHIESINQQESIDQQ